MKSPADGHRHGAPRLAADASSNRIRDGRYTFQGRQLQLPINESERHNAIHGLAREVSWQATEHRSDSVTLEYLIEPTPGYPFALGCAVTYSLDERGLRCRIRLENRGSDPLPVGAGHHPYLRPGPPPADTWLMRIPATRVIEVDDRLLPTGREPEVSGTEHDFRSEREIGSLELDIAYTGLEPDPDGIVRASLISPDGNRLTLWAGPETTHLMVYTGQAIQRTGVALEPMSCPPNAFQSGQDVKVLQPGAGWTLDWGIEPDRS